MCVKSRSSLLKKCLLLRVITETLALIGGGMEAEGAQGAHHPVAPSHLLPLCASSPDLLPASGAVRSAEPPSFIKRYVLCSRGTSYRVDGALVVHGPAMACTGVLPAMHVHHQRASWAVAPRQPLYSPLARMSRTHCTKKPAWQPRP